MKRFFFFFMALALASVSFAQDVLVKKDGGTILAKILRITETEVEYKNFDNPDGPTRVISISNLLRINYQNGQIETFSAEASDDIVTKETATKFSDDQKLLQMYNSMRTTPVAKTVKRLRITGWVAGSALVVTGLIVGATFRNYDHYDHYSLGHRQFRNRHVGTGIAFVGVGVPIWIGCCVSARKLEKKSKYSVESAPVFQQEFNVGRNERLMVGVDMLNDNTMKHQTVGMGLRYNF